MLTLSNEALVAINNSTIETLKLYKIEYQETVGGPSLYLYLTDYSEDIHYVAGDGQLYISSTVKSGDLTQSSDGKVARTVLSIGNIDEERVIQRYLEDYVVIGNKATISQFFVDVETGLLINSPISTTFKIAGAKANKGQVDFDLSIGFDFLKSTIPNRKVYGRYCRWKTFKGSECKYAGADTTCEKTFDDCRAKGNIVNFGGFPAVINQRFYV